MLPFKKLADFERRAKWSRSESQRRQSVLESFGLTRHQRKGEKASFRAVGDKYNFGFKTQFFWQQSEMQVRSQKTQQTQDTRDSVPG